MKSSVEIGVFFLMTGSLFVTSCHSSFERKEHEKTNVIFILADDMGWAQSGIYGSDLHGCILPTSSPEIRIPITL
jgi:hypothetical protein